MSTYVCPHCGGRIDPMRWSMRIESGVATTQPLMVPVNRDPTDDIAAITAQRDRLLAYVRAERALSRLLDDGPATDDQFWPLKQAEAVALQALLDAGDITEDDA